MYGMNQCNKVSVYGGWVHVQVKMQKTGCSLLKQKAAKQSKQTTTTHHPKNKEDSQWTKWNCETTVLVDAAVQAETLAFQLKLSLCMKPSP